LSQRLQVPRILWFAIFGSTLIFIVLRFVIPMEPVKAEPMMLPLLGLCALSSLVMSFFLPARLGNQARRAQKLEIVESADPNATSDVIPGSAGPKRRVFADPKKAIGAAFMTYQSPFILGMALSESVALSGLVLWFLGFGLAEGLPFFVLAWISMALRFPTLDKVIVPFERAHDAVIPRG
jgi:hypothetical protein